MRYMGTETPHEAKWEDTCPQCGSSVSATFTAWKYPTGAFNDADFNYSRIFLC